MIYRMQDYFKLLQVDANASTEDIKRAYHSLCLKYHPDKYGGDTEKFVEIQKAYEAIIQYQNTKINFFNVLLSFIHILSVKKDTTLCICVKIEDVYHNRIQKIVYHRWNKLFVRERKTIFLDFVEWQETYVLEGMGDYDNFTGQYYNLVVNIELDFSEHLRWSLQKDIDLYELYTTFDINIYEFYYGMESEIDLMNTKLEISHNPYREGDVKVVKNKGLYNGDNARADIYIIFKVDMFNVSIDFEKDRHILEKIFNTPCYYDKLT